MASTKNVQSQKFIRENRVKKKILNVNIMLKILFHLFGLIHHLFGNYYFSTFIVLPNLYNSNEELRRLVQYSAGLGTGWNFVSIFFNFNL